LRSSTHKDSQFNPQVFSPLNLEKVNNQSSPLQATFSLLRPDQPRLKPPTLLRLFVLLMNKPTLLSERRFSTLVPLVTTHVCQSDSGEMAQESRALFSLNDLFPFLI
jgi:hypothetical protein